MIMMSHNERLKQRRNIVILGSSGGGTATIGSNRTSNSGNPVADFLQCIHRQLLTIDCQLTAGYFVTLNDTGKGFDTCNLSTDRATLYEIVHQNLPPASSLTTPSTTNATSTVPTDDDKVLEEKDETSAVGTISVVQIFVGTVNEVNEYIQKSKLDEQIASMIQRKHLNQVDDDCSLSIDGLIIVSCRVELFEQTLMAVASRQQQQQHQCEQQHDFFPISQFPVTGSGGSSLSKAVALYRIQLTGNAGGSVATTSYTKAISYTAAIANYYKISYHPWIANTSKLVSSGTTTTKYVNMKEIVSKYYSIFTSTINSCLPAFWTVLILKSALVWIIHQYHYSSSTSTMLSSNIPLVVRRHDSNFIQQLQLILYFLENYVLSICCCLRMVTTETTVRTRESTSTSNEDEVVEEIVPVTTLLFASVLCTVFIGQRSVLTSLVIGYCIKPLAIRIIYECIIRNIPATMTNLLTILLTVVVIVTFIAPISIVLCYCTNTINTIMITVLTSDSMYIRTIFAASCGLVSCYGSKVGWYHLYHLPIILSIEMDYVGIGPTFLGAIDELTLVLVCSGICTANILVHSFSGPSNSGVSTEDALLCRRGVLINMLYGDFVEVCYPYMDRSSIVNVSGYIASAISCAYLVYDNNNSTVIKEMYDDRNLIPKSFAYVPFPVAVALSGPRWVTMVKASCIAFGIPFLGTIIASVFSNNTKTNQNSKDTKTASMEMTAKYAKKRK